MVRIIQYDPKITAEAYSRRQAAERRFEGPVAAGLGQLGRALMAREERREPGHQDKTKAMHALTRMRKKEFARLKEQGGFRTLEQRWSAKGFLEAYLQRRDEDIAALAKENPRAARILAEKTATLTEDLSRRAMVMESGNTGDALVADINGAVTDAIETVRADPSQREAVLSEFRATLTGLAEAGMDADATATIIGAAERKITGAAFRQRLTDDPEAAREELAAGEFGDSLLPEQAEALMAKADQAVKLRQRQTEAAAKSAEDGFITEFRDYEQRLFNGEAPDDENFSDEAIMAGVSPDVADRLIRERDRAETRGRAFAEIEFMSETEIEERLGEAGRDEVRHLLWARGHRWQLMKQGPAAFALRDPIVGQAHERWLQARADGNAAAAGQAGQAYANAALALQRRMGLSAPDRSVLTTDMAAELVRQTELPDGQDAGTLGAMIRDQFGEHWRVALADMERVGLSEQVAIIAGLGRPGQQPAARQLAGLVGTRTSNLRDSAGDAAAAIDGLLDITFGRARATPGQHGIDHDTSRGELVRRRAYALAAEGWAPGRAVQRAIEDLSVANTSEGAGSDARSVAVLAESQGIHPSALGDGGAAVASILERFTRFGDLSDDQLIALKGDIQELRGGHEAYPALRDRFVDLENSVALFDPPVVPAGPEPVTSPFEASFEEFVAAADATAPPVVDAIFNRLRGRLITTRQETGDLNRAWINHALTGNDPRRTEFAALFLSEMGGAIPLQNVLSEVAQGAYLDFWKERYSPEDRIEIGLGRPSDAWLSTIVHTRFSGTDWPLPSDLTGDILLAISRSSAATDRQRLALVDHIKRVVAPFHPGMSVYFQQAVLALNVGEGGFGEVPAQFAFLFSHEQLVEAALSRGIIVPSHINTEPEAPPDLVGDVDVIMNAGSAGLGAVGVAGAIVAGATPLGLALAIAGAGLSGLGLIGAIDDNNEAHTEYFIYKEFYNRFQDPQVGPGLETFLRQQSNPERSPVQGSQSDGAGGTSASPFAQ